jgi:peroxiredoxin
MVATQTPICDFGWKAVDFNLKDPDGRSYTLADVAGPKGTLVMFICNHCPYVLAVADRIAKDAKELKEKGIGIVAIMPNDYQRYPADSPANMKVFAQQHGFDFPYVVDENQEVARTYDAVCTPDFYGFNSALELQYRGRLDESRRELAANAQRELFEAMCQVAETGRGPENQTASMGCSIKWREAGS